MDVSVRELRSHTGRVSERRPTELLLADLESIRRMAEDLDVESEASDFDALTWLTKPSSFTSEG